MTPSQEAVIQPPINEQLGAHYELTGHWYQKYAFWGDYEEQPERVEAIGQQILAINPELVAYPENDPQSAADHARQMYWRAEYLQHRYDEEVIEARLDQLTGLMQKGVFSDELERHVRVQAGIESRIASEQPIREIDAARRGMAVMMIDLDGFKPLNDTYGHKVGDEVLVEVAHILNRTIRESDIVARLGGDEFAIILNSGIDVESAEAVKQRIISEIEKISVKRCFDLDIEPMTGLVGASIGYVFFQLGMSSNQLLSQADEEMYRIKRSQTRRNS